MSLHPAPAPDRLRVESMHDLELLPADAAALAAMIESRPYVGAFVSPAWLSGYFAEPPAGAEPSLVLLREGAALRAVVPIAVDATRAHVRVSLLGGGFGSDRVDLLAARGFEALAADSFLAWLGERFGPRGFLLELRDVPASSSLWGAVQRAGAEQTLRLVVRPTEVYTLPYLTLGDPAPADAGETPSSRSLRSLQKHRRWLGHRCRLTVDRLDQVDDVLAAFDELVRFLHVRWSGHAGSALDDPRVMRFHHRALPQLLREGRLWMFRLTGDHRTLAVFYGLTSGRWRGYYLAGFDREWAGRIRLGQITLAAAIERASEEGAAEFDFLKGAERIKYAWPVRERGTVDADVFSDRSTAQFARATRSTRDAAAALTKSARDLVSTSLGL